MRVAPGAVVGGLLALGVVLGGCSVPHETVSASETSLIQSSLKTDGFRRFLGDPTADATVGCADRIMGSDRRGSRVYLYVACGAWRPPKCGATDGPNGSFPVVATVRGRSVAWREPSDGPDYAPSIHRLFPRSLWSAALSPGDEPALVTAAERDAGCSA